MNDGAPFDPESPDTNPKDRKDWYEGEKVRVDLEVRRGNLVTLDEYRAEIARILKSLAGTLETLPDVLERSCGLQPSVVVALQNEIDRERAALADRLLADEPGAT